LAKTALVDAPQGALGASADALPRILGATRVKEGLPSADDKSIQLLGVIAGSSGQGSALLAIDGQAPKPFRVGQTVSDGLVLQRLDARRAQLGASLNGPTLRELQLPPLQKP
jgi:general secretion pathway protein C